MNCYKINDVLASTWGVLLYCYFVAFCLARMYPKSMTWATLTGGYLPGAGSHEWNFLYRCCAVDSLTNGAAKLLPVLSTVHALHLQVLVHGLNLHPCHRQLRHGASSAVLRHETNSRANGLLCSVRTECRLAFALSADQSRAPGNSGSVRLVAMLVMQTSPPSPVLGFVLL